MERIRDIHRIVVLQCDECGDPRVGCRDLACAMQSRPYTGQDVVPADIHQAAIDALQPSSPVQRVLHDFAVKLRELDDRNVRTKGNALSREDPRDLVQRIESMCAGLGMLGRTPEVDHARAIGAYALALALACARVEELDVAAGDEAAPVHLTNAARTLENIMRAKGQDVDVRVKPEDAA